MDVSLGRRTASGILFTPSGLSFTFTEKSTRSGAILGTNTAAGERNRNQRRLADTNSSCKTRKQANTTITTIKFYLMKNPEENVPRSTRTNFSHSRRGASMDLASYCTPRKSRNQSYKVDAMASERTPRGGARRKAPSKASELTELCGTSQNSEAPASDDAAFQASDVPWEDNNVVVNENHWYIYDPYRDMRMDIDNMSYEELLALGERIGTVSTAISEEDLSKCLKRSKCTSGSGCATCSICQEEFVEGDELGEVVCEHVYHATCIEQWLKSKNWCPLCKGSASPSLS